MGKSTPLVLAALLIGNPVLGLPPTAARAQQDAPGDVDQLMDQLRDNDSAVRSFAAVALAEPGAGAKGAVRGLVALLADEDGDARRSAVAARENGDPSPGTGAKGRGDVVLKRPHVQSEV